MTELLASASLFDARGGSPLGSAIGWINGTLLGSTATILCVLAVATIGLLMLTGRFPVKESLRVVLGCFLLLGAPALALAISTGWRQASPPAPPPVVVFEQSDPRGDLPPAPAPPPVPAEQP